MMKIRRGKFVMALLILAMSLTFIAPMAHAEQVESGEIPVTISLIGTPPEVDESYRIVMKASNKDFPMPAGSQDGIHTITIEGQDTVNLPKIEFSSVGIYSYEIWQEKGDSVLVEEYDESVYNLMIYVTNKEDMEGLEISALLYQPEENTKFDEIEFINRYALVAGEDDLDDDPKEEPKEEPEEEEDEKIELVAGEDDLDNLPKTGSGSTTIYIVLGGIFLLLGLISLIKRKTIK